MHWGLLLPFGEERERSRALGQERHRALLRGGSESSDWAKRRGRTVAGMIILTGEQVRQVPVHVGASHSSRDGWDLQEQRSSRVAVAGDGHLFWEGTSRSRASVPPNPNPRRRRRVPWNGKVPGAEESSAHSQSRAPTYVIVLEKKKNGTAGRTER